ncbi:hypothetical protein [Thalassospira lucentensis]|uniref:hypothetical protein n=1 Tax=Thalassospira lucentensis TaxID=168935 RepID=UPI003AA94E29
MKLRVLAEIATVAGFILTLYLYLTEGKNALDALPADLVPQAEEDLLNVETNFDVTQLSDTGAAAYNMMQAGKLARSISDQDKILTTAVQMAIDAGEYQVALSAADSINNVLNGAEAFLLIATHAVQKKETIAYAIIAAEKCDYYTVEAEILRMITDVYEGRIPGEISDDEVFKEIFSFAHSGAYMDMSNEDARDFTEGWIKQYSYEDFLFFKEVFVFAESSSGLDQTEQVARKFSENFISEYSQDQFARFKDLFEFAHSGSGLDLGELEAQEYALGKLVKERN